MQPANGSAGRAVPAKRRRADQDGFFDHVSIEKSFSLFGMLMAVSLIVAFGLDLALGWPFLRASVLFDISSVVCGLGLAYASWDVIRDQIRGRS